MTEEDVNRINEEHRKDQKSDTHGDYSQAGKSLITHPDEDRKKSMVEGIIQDLANQRNDIDSIKMGMGQMAEMMNQQTQALNNLAQTIQPQTAQSQQPGVQGLQGLNMESISAIGDLVEKGISAYKSLKGAPPSETPLISEGFIKERMVKSFMDDLDTGTSITNFIKDSLKKKVTKEVINTTFKDMGNHEPSSHAPQ